MSTVTREEFDLLAQRIELIMDAFNKFDVGLQRMEKQNDDIREQNNGFKDLLERLLLHLTKRTEDLVRIMGDGADGRDRVN